MLETARLAIKAGHAVRVIQTEAAQQFVGTLIGPGSRDLASHGEHGVGRMSEPAELVAAIEAQLAGARRPLRRPWFGVRVLITAGGTREPIDSVRYIGNRSSGRMGFALAAEASARGAEVTVIAANVALPPPAGARIIEVETAAQMAAACRREFPVTQV